MKAITHRHRERKEETKPETTHRHLERKKKIMPQEIEVWYLIPALRRELAKIFIKDYSFTQKKSAEILGITNAAISQYLSSKRGEKINFKEKEVKEIKKSAEKIIKKNGNLIKELYDLCVSLRKSKIICDMHRRQDQNILEDCDICFK